MRQALLIQYQSRVLKGPLNGVIVVGLCSYVSGPIALQNLAMQGALVIKIEPKPLGDPTRRVFSPSFFNSLNQSQLSVVFDKNSEKDQRLLERLFEVADVIVDNRSVRARENDHLLQSYFNKRGKLSPKIYCSINAFPNAAVNNLAGVDASIQASTGLAYTNCAPDGSPLKVGVPVLDQVSGLLAANCILANLYLLKQRSEPLPDNKIISIAVSLAGVSIWLQTGQVLSALEGKEIFRTGNQDPFAAPFSYYTAQDGLISIATVNEDQFKRFCLDVLKDSDFHKKYPTIKIRIEQQTAFEQALNEKLKMQTSSYWYELCKKHQVPVSRVLTVSEAIQQDFVRELISSTRDGTPIISPGIEHSLFSSQKPAPAPQLNEDYKKVSFLLKSKL